MSILETKRIWLLGGLLMFSIAACSVVTAVPRITPTPTSHTVETTVPPLPTNTDEPTAVPPTTPPTDTPLPQPSPSPIIAPTTTTVPTAIPTAVPPTVVPTPTFAAFGITQTLGLSTQGRPITSYRFGYGARQVVLVGGLHGGYEWNTIMLMYEVIDYFRENPQQIPQNVTLTILPAANPDGQFLATNQDGRFTPDQVQPNVTAGRFNGNQVDLNRNWDCQWQASGLWGERVVSGGERPFSELETQTLRRFFLGQRVDAVIFYHSKADGVYAGGCEGVYQPSLDLTTIYGEASGYPIYEQFTHYEVTGDASDWLALQSIPSFTVELKTRNGTDLPENLAGILATLSFYANR